MYSNSSRWMSGGNGRFGDQRAPGRHSRHRAASRSGRHCWRTVERMPSAADQQVALAAAAVGEMRHHRRAGLCSKRCERRARDGNAPAGTRRAAGGRRRSQAVSICGHSTLADEAAVDVEDLAASCIATPRSRRLDAERRGCARSAPAARRCRRRGRTARFRRARRCRRPSRARRSQRREQAAHRAADHEGPPFPCCAHSTRSRGFQPARSLLYIATKPWRNAMALTHAGQEGRAVRDSSAWPAADQGRIRAREPATPIGCVGTALLSETDRVRVWIIRLQPGERVGFHRHVLDYFWTSVNGGRGRQHLHGRHHGRVHLRARRDAPRDLRAGRVQGPRPRKSRRQGDDLQDHRIPATAPTSRWRCRTRCADRPRPDACSPYGR